MHNEENQKQILLKIHLKSTNELLIEFEFQASDELCLRLSDRVGTSIDEGRPLVIHGGCKMITFDSTIHYLYTEEIGYL